MTERGYRLVSFENVLGRSLSVESERVTPPGVQVRRIGEDELDAWVDVVVDAFMHPDTEGLPQHEQFPREAIERAERDLVAAPGVVCYLALLDGVVAGGASMRMAQGALHPRRSGQATLSPPAHRARQSARNTEQQHFAAESQNSGSSVARSV